MSQAQILHPGDRSKTNSLKLSGIDCAGCAAKLEKKLARTPGVESVRVSFGTGKLTVRHTLPLDKIISLVKEAGYAVDEEDSRLSETMELSVYQIQGRINSMTVNFVKYISIQTQLLISTVNPGN